MKFVDSSAEVIAEPNPYKKVERIGRICYKSEDRITEDSYKGFFERMKNNQHFAMLEHGAVEVELSGTSRDLDSILRVLLNIPGVWMDDPYSVFCSRVHLNLSHLYNPEWRQVHVLEEIRETLEYQFGLRDTRPTPFRVGMVAPDPFVHSVKFTVDRGVSHELVRHRCSVAQSSTRYCNYSKDKYGSELTYVSPHFAIDLSFDTYILAGIADEYLHTAEALYMDLIEHGYAPEDARYYLPNALMTEVVLTMPIHQWRHFFAVRADGVTGRPHPAMQKVAKQAREALDAYLKSISE